MTCNISKIVEKIIGHPLVNFLQQFGFGDSQWAFRKKSSSKDLLTVMTGTWIRTICSGHKIGAYFNDIAGAFDRVDKTYLLGKLRNIGVSDNFVDFLSSYLDPRIGRVTIEAAFSDTFEICNMIYQGTVLGPPLWNTFFHDIEGPATFEGGSATIFADDLNVFQIFPLDVQNAQILEIMERTRKNVHQWGKRNRVTFEPSKENLAVIHPSSGEGETFKLLGCMFDVNLKMDIEIERICSITKPKINAMLRIANLYTKTDMIQQFKTHIWGYFEYSCGSILYATENQLQKIDNIQTRFLRHLNIDEDVAFLEYNFAPTMLRRDIGILGFIHKRILNDCHP